MSNDMQELTQGKEQISDSIRGHKANLSNPSEPLSQGHIITGSSGC